MRVLFLLMVLSGCVDKNIQAHEAAKSIGKENKVCYTVISPEHIKGYYCLEYIRGE